MSQTNFQSRIEFTKPALVFSGGATKAAAFHVGVCLALRDKGFSFVGGKLDHPTPIDACPFPRPRFHPHQIATYVGSSAGALVCGMLASGLTVESIINSFSKDTAFKAPGEHREIPRINYRDILTIKWPSIPGLLKSFKRRAPVSASLESTILNNLRLPGMFSTRGLAQYLKAHILPTEHFTELKPDFFVIGTQLDHSRKIIFARFGTEKTFDGYCQYASGVPISDAIAASMSLPPIFAPYLIEHPNGKKRFYIDGEIRETLSTHAAKENDCDLIICSYTHQPYHYSEETGSLNNYGASAIAVQSIYQAIEQKIYGVKKAHDTKLKVLETIREYFTEKGYKKEDMEEIVSRLQTRLDFKENLKYLYIHPEPQDHEMFFGDHFSLAAKTIQKIITIGYRRAMAVLRKYELVPKTTQ